MMRLIALRTQTSEPKTVATTPGGRHQDPRSTARRNDTAVPGNARLNQEMADLAQVIIQQELERLVEQWAADAFASEPENYGYFDECDWRWYPRGETLDELRDSLIDLVNHYFITAIQGIWDNLDAAELMRKTAEVPDGARMPRWLVDDIRGDIEYHRRRDEGLL